jgi:hypothetical protein
LSGAKVPGLLDLDGYRGGVDATDMADLVNPWSFFGRKGEGDGLIVVRSRALLFRAASSIYHFRRSFERFVCTWPTPSLSARRSLSQKGHFNPLWEFFKLSSVGLDTEKSFGGKCTRSSTVYRVKVVHLVRARGDPDVVVVVLVGVWNEAVNKFSELDSARTRWEIETEFRCSGMMWFMTKLAPGMFKRQTQSVMESFKTFAEDESKSSS